MGCSRFAESRKRWARKFLPSHFLIWSSFGNARAVSGLEKFS